MATPEQIQTYQKLKAKGYTPEDFAQRGIDSTAFEEAPKIPPQDKIDKYSALVAKGYTDEDFAQRGIDVTPFKTALTTTTTIPETEEPGVLSEFAGDIPEMIAGTVGGLVPGPAGIVTAGVGGAAGEAGKQLFQQVTSAGEAPATSREALLRIANAFKRQAGAEVMGRGTFQIAKKVLAPFAKTVTKAGKEAIEFVKEKGIEGVITPAQATATRILDVAENVARGSIFGGGRIAKNTLQSEKSFKAFIEKELGEKIDPDLAGEFFAKAVKMRERLAKAPASKLYDEVRKLVSEDIGGATVSMKEVKAFAKPLVEIGKEAGGLEATKFGDEVVSLLASRKDTMTFAGAQELRSKLRSLQRTLIKEGTNKPALAKTRQAIELMTGTLEKSLKEFDEINGTNALQMFNRAETLWKKQSAIFKTKTLIKVGKLAEDVPHKISEEIFRPNAIIAIRRAKAASTPEAWNKLTKQHLQTMFAQSEEVSKVEKSLKIISGSKLEDKMFGARGLGEKAMKIAYGETATKNYKQLVNALNITQAKQAEGAGGMLVQLMQAKGLVQFGGALVGAAGFGWSSLGILVGPEILAQIMTRPKAAKWLIEGVQLPKNSPKALAFAARLGVEVAKITGKKNNIPQPKKNNSEPLKATIKENLESKENDLKLISADEAKKIGTRTNPKTGEVQIFKDGKWQKR